MTLKNNEDYFAYYILQSSLLETDGDIGQVYLSHNCMEICFVSLINFATEADFFIRIVILNFILVFLIVLLRL